jgi:dimethylaniline monooxygenase (N-oxide forming)
VGLIRLEYPTYMQPHHFQEYMEDYAKHFDLLRDIVFGADVKLARRSGDDARWLLDVERDGKIETVEYDRTVFCHGYQTKADIPAFEGQEKFEGVMMHSQAYREYVSFFEF